MSERIPNPEAVERLAKTVTVKAAAADGSLFDIVIDVITIGDNPGKVLRLHRVYPEGQRFGLIVRGRDLEMLPELIGVLAKERYT